MSESFDLESPDLFTTGTVGPPGQRVFYLQAREAGSVVTLKVEKEQVGALADYLAGVLEKQPAAAAGRKPGADLALIEPLAPAWAIGSLGIGYDEGAGRIVIVAHEQREDDEEADGEAATARFRISHGQAAAFVDRARALVKAGRPSCPICGQPKNPSGHVCPRSNGHGRH